MTSAIQQAIEEIEQDIEGLQQGIVDRQPESPQEPSR